MITEQFPNVDKSMKEESAPQVDAGYRHFEARLCGAWQRQ